MCLECEQRNGQKTEVDVESQFQLALHDELWRTAYIQGLYMQTVSRIVGCTGEKPIGEGPDDVNFLYY